jgi:hypothetical protein
MALHRRINKQAFPIFFRSLGWLLLAALLPAVVYGYTQGPWVGVKVLLVFVTAAVLGLLLAFWGALFPKSGGS